ncbi:hypothetical protein DV737_g2588, partial [Chaetothyriales sp. CBS 132003]
MAEIDGATPKEQILEACRRDNVELFHEVLRGMEGQSVEQIAQFFNDMTDTLGNHLLHVCANYGSSRYPLSIFWGPADLTAVDVMDELLNLEQLECDPLTPRDKETPIHRAVAYANEREIDLGEAMAKILIEAGGDPRVKDKHGRKPADICTPRTEQIRVMLRQEEYALNEGLKNGDVPQDDDDGPTGSASDSD